MVVYKIKRFARADYIGLSKKQAAALRKKRNEIAKKLLQERSKINKKFLEESKERLMNPASYEHQRFVNQGIFRDNRVTKDASGQIQTRNYFGRKKSHSDEDIVKNVINNKKYGFAWEKGNRRDAHSSSIMKAREDASNARRNIIRNSNIKKALGGIALGTGIGYGAYKMSNEKED